MYVEHSGWNQERGAFCDKIYVDEQKSDYEIHFPDGSVAKQAYPFEEVTRDWNNDGDVYTEFGAYFNHDGRNDFWTPVEMVTSLLNKRVTAIPGIELPGHEKKTSIEDQIWQSERRAMHQDAERNRKMDMLGIRPPNEPWAK